VNSIPLLVNKIIIMYIKNIKGDCNNIVITVFLKVNFVWKYIKNIFFYLLKFIFDTKMI